ncbi:MAG: M23 family metallopeptidase [Actinobacteria bacterium]|nr:M23 family metallopeptidase [Actinomycetota bacterium]
MPMFAFAFSILLLPPAPIAHSAGVYTFPISGCKVTYAHSHHNYPATDILGKKGCAYVAVTNGVVDEVNRVDRFNWKTNLGADRGGLSISIVGADGVRYYGSHLMSIEKGIAPGVEVVVGQVLGKLGDSGDAKGLAPHVHFGISWQTPPKIWWVRRGELYPWKYLDAWKAGKDLSPANAVAALEKKLGNVPKQVGY